MPIGMSKAMTKRERRERQIIAATFSALSCAEGWDREEPRELFLAVQARLRYEEPKTIASFDEALRNKWEQYKLEEA